jgi:class 3 adenylate cyclase
VLLVYTDDGHVRHGFLAAILLHVALQRQCYRYNTPGSAAACPPISFGIGIESGPVSRVLAQSPYDLGGLPVDTYIGPSINVASRAETVSKQLHRANTVVAQKINALLCESLFEENYEDLMASSLDHAIADTARLVLHDRMSDLNRRLCLSFIHQHHLKGVAQPVSLFRFSDSAIYFGNPRFNALLVLLTDDADHLEDVANALHRKAGHERADISGLY